MSGLNRQDIEILKHYAERGNRELYWNYLSHKTGNDGYPLLALGVVRNDSAPGQIANIYATNYAWDHGRDRMGERGWQNFGVDLMRNDLAARERMLERGHPELALNLPVREVQRSHDDAFRQAGIDPNAWTPRLLLDGARRHRGEAGAEQVWDRMLDDRGMGLLRLGRSTTDMISYDAEGSLGRIAAARVLATQALPNIDPDTIGAKNHHYTYNPRHREWAVISGGGEMMVLPRRVTDSGKLAELNEARAVRLERQNMRDDFHPADPYRNLPIQRSPRTIAQNDLAPDVGSLEPSGSAPALAAADPRLPHALGNAVYRQLEAGVDALGIQAGGVSAGCNARSTMSLYAACAGQGITSADHVMLNCQGTEHAAGSLLLVVQGQDPFDPANRRAYLDASDAANRPVEQSLRQAQDIQMQQALQPPAQDQQQAPSMGQSGPVLTR